MNRVRAHRRYKVNLHPLKLQRGGTLVTQQVCTRCRRTLRKTA
jgi:ribosomal protein L28